MDFRKAKPYYARRHGKWTAIGGYSSRPRTLKLTTQGKYGELMATAMDKKRPDVRMALSVAEQVHEAGGQALFVGGFVRDALLGKSNKDIDVEVYGLSPDKVSEILSGLGKVDAVGASFGVLKVSHPDLSEPLDVSLPRRESKTGIGHKGFLVEADPTMTIREAARRRDFTINNLAYDPLTKTVHDEFGGLEDLENKVLRATDPMTFVEDPLRVLRAMQFAARLGFVIDKDTLDLCRKLNLAELPKERVFEEFRKLFTANRPSLGLRYFADLGLEKILPEVGRLRETQQDPKFHPEGNAWDHTLMVVDQAAKFRDTFRDPKKFISFMFAAFFHDLGKPDTTYRSEQTGFIVSPGHDKLGEKIVRDVMARLTAEPDVIEDAAVLTREHLQPSNLFQGKAKDSAIRRLALRVDIPTLAKLSSADKKGRGAQDWRTEKKGALGTDWLNLEAEKWLLDRYKNLSLDKPNTLQPLVMGRHMIELGVKPGVEMGKMLKTLFEAQLDGKFSTVEGGIELARQEGLLPEIVKSKRVFVPQSPYHRAYYREDPRTPSPPMEGSPAPPLLQYSDLKELAQRFLTEFVNSDIRDPMGDRIEFAPKDFLHISKIDTGTADKYRCERLLWIKDIIQNPDLVVKDERDPNARLFIKWYHGEPYLFVCRVQSGKFHSVTAYPLESPAKVRALLRQERVYTRTGLLLKSTAGLHSVKVPVKGKTKTYYATRWMSAEEPESNAELLHRLKDKIGSNMLFTEQELRNQMREARADNHTVEAVVEGRQKVVTEGEGGETSKKAAAVGLFVAWRGGIPIISKTEADAKHMLDYLDSGGNYGSAKFSQLLGYTDDQIATYVAFLKKTGQESYLEKGGKIGKTPVKRLIQGPTGTYYAIRWMGRATKKSNRKFLEGLVHFRDEKDFTLEGLRAADLAVVEMRNRFGYRWGRNDLTGEVYGYMNAPVFLGELGFTSDEYYGLKDVSLHDPTEANYDVYKDANSYYVSHEPGKLFLSWNFTPLAVLKGMGWHALSREDVKIRNQTIYEFEADNPNGFKSLFDEKKNEIQDFLGIRVDHWVDALLYLYALRRSGKEVPFNWMDRSYVLGEADYRTREHGAVKFPKDLPMFVAGSRLDKMAKEEAANFVKQLEEDQNIKFVKNFLKMDLNDAPENVKINVLMQMRKFYDKLSQPGPKLDIYNKISEAAAFFYPDLVGMTDELKNTFNEFQRKVFSAHNYVDIINAIAEERKSSDETPEAQWELRALKLCMADAAMDELATVFGKWRFEKYEGEVPEVKYIDTAEAEKAKFEKPAEENESKLKNATVLAMNWVKTYIHPEMRTPIDLEIIASRPDIGGDCSAQYVRITEASVNWWPESTVIHEYGHAMDHALMNRDNKRGMLTDDLFKSFFDWRTKGCTPEKTEYYEFCRDKFAQDYAGRLYGSRGGVEIPSVGLALMQQDAGSFMLRDPVHFFLTYAFMSNDLRFTEAKK